MRIDKIVRSAGFIRNMKTYSLIVKDNALYLITTGPADRTIYQPTMIQEKTAEWIKEKYEDRVTAGEQALGSMSLDVLSKQKHNFKIKLPDDLISFTIKENVYKIPILYLKTKQGNFKFEIRTMTLAEANESIAAELQKS